MQNEKLKCFKCGKEIGELVYDGGMNSALGFVPCYSMKRDYRKAAHVPVAKGDGVCKACARKSFPEGKSYSVNFKYHGSELTCGGGLYEYYNRFASYKDAKELCDKMNRKGTGVMYWVVEHKL
jgi:hypothetical protein